MNWLKFVSCQLLLIVNCFVSATIEQEVGGEIEDQEFCDTSSNAESCSLYSKQNGQTTQHNDRSSIHSISKDHIEQTINSIDNCFRASVVQLNRIDSNTCKESVQFNLNTLDKAALIAAKHGARMIVFPEDGIFIGNLTFITPCLEDVPDPNQLETSDNNPCTQSTTVDYFKSTPILNRLSCIARYYNVYVIANYGTKQNCTVTEQKDCDGGFIPLNTDVVFDPNGNFIRRYRKYNIFTEVFSKAPSLEIVHFDIPHFGRFGLFTCFDILFKSPAIDLVEKYDIDTIIFPTWWFDELPILSALQLQDGWSWLNNVNLLASNILRPALGSTGSGIFTGKDSIHIGADSNKSHLLIANISPKNDGKCSRQQFNPLRIELDDAPANEAYHHKNYEVYEQDSVSKLGDISGERTSCSGRVCCSIVYKLDDDSKRDLVDKLVLIARDSHRSGPFKWREQACALATLKLKGPVHDISISETGETHARNLTYNTEALVGFKHLALNGTFTTKFVYPYAAHNVSHLIHRDKRQFDCDRLGSTTEIIYRCRHDLLAGNNDDLMSVRIYSFGMYARPYEEDIFQ